MEEEVSIELKEVFQIIKQRMILILSITLSLTLISAILTFFVLKPVYEAQTSIIVGKEQGDNLTQSDVMMYQNLIKTYSQIAESRVVAENVIKQLNLNMTPESLQKSLKVTNQTGTQILIISAQSNNPVDASKIAAAAANAFVDESQKLLPSGNVQVMDNAQVPQQPVKPNKMLNLAAAFFIGIILSIGLVFLLEYLDDTIKNENDIEKHLNIPVIGVIPKYK